MSGSVAPEGTASRSQPDGFDLDFEITADHLVDFVRLRQRTLNLVGTIGAIGLIAVGIYFAVSGDLVLGVFEIVVAAFMLIAARTRLIDTWRVRRVGRSVIGTSAEISARREGMDIRNAGMASHVDWASITVVKANDRIIIPMRDRMPVGWIPTDAFSSTAARDEALAFMRAQVAAARRD